MVVFNLYAHHKKLSFHLKSWNLSFSTFDHCFRISFRLPIKLRKLIYSKYNQHRNTKPSKLSCLKKNRDFFKITRTISPPPWGVRADMTLIPSLCEIGRYKLLFQSFWYGMSLLPIPPPPTLLMRDRKFWKSCGVLSQKLCF